MCNIHEIKLNSDIFIDIISTIKDPEKPGTLEDLNVVYEDGVKVIGHGDHNCDVEVRFRFVKYVVLNYVSLLNLYEVVLFFVVVIVKIFFLTCNKFITHKTMNRKPLSTLLHLNKYQ